MAVFRCCALPLSSTSTTSCKNPPSSHKITIARTTSSRFLNFINNPNRQLSTFSCTTSTYSTTSNSDPSSSASSSSTLSTSSNGSGAPPVVKKRKRYRRARPGETKGITEEMRFVAMKLRSSKFADGDDKVEDEDNGLSPSETWQPSLEGFLKYLVDSKLVFETLERIVEESNDVSYAYFRKTGLERSASLVMDLEWFSQTNIMIPEPSNPGLSYAAYLEQLAEKSAPLFLCHLYNVYFSHIAGGQVISRLVSEKLLDGRELEFCRWEGDPQLLLKDVREKLNRLAEHWSRDVKSKCLKEATKSFRFLGQIFHDFPNLSILLHAFSMGIAPYVALAKQSATCIHVSGGLEETITRSIIHLRKQQPCLMQLCLLRIDYGHMLAMNQFPFNLSS